MTVIKSSIKLAASTALMLLPIIGFAATSTSYCTYTLNAKFPDSAPADAGITAGVCITGGSCYSKVLHPSDATYSPQYVPCGSGTISYSQGAGVYRAIVSFSYQNGFKITDENTEQGYLLTTGVNSKEITTTLFLSK